MFLKKNRLIADDLVKVKCRQQQECSGEMWLTWMVRDKRRPVNQFNAGTRDFSRGSGICISIISGWISLVLYCFMLFFWPSPNVTCSWFNDLQYLFYFIIFSECQNYNNNNKQPLATTKWINWSMICRIKLNKIYSSVGRRPSFPAWFFDMKWLERSSC